MNTTTPNLGSLNFVFLHVPDVAAVRSFYVETLELELVDENTTFLMFRHADGATLGIGVDTESFFKAKHTVDETSPVELWWQVEDADAVHATLVERGVRIVTEPKDEPFGRALAFADPAGNILCAYQPPKA